MEPLFSGMLDHASEWGTLDGFQHDVLAAIAEQCDAPAASLWRYEKKQAMLHLQALYRRRREPAARKASNHDSCLSGRTIKADSLWEELSSKRRPITLNVMKDRGSPFRHLMIGTEHKHLLLVPLTRAEEAIGLISLAVADVKKLDKTEWTDSLSQQIVLAWKLTALLDSKLYSAILQERNRIARDLHDALAQSFTGMLIQIDLAEEILSKSRRERQQHIVRMRQLAQEGLTELRHAVLGLHQPLTKKRCLVDALQQLTAKFNSASGGARAEFHVQGSIPALPVKTLAHLLRIAQEALTNILKYAHATQVRIELAADGGRLQLGIRDDGAGFDPSTVSTSCFGLKSMQERARLIRGRLNVSSGSRCGTQVQVTMPFESGPTVGKSA